MLKTIRILLIIIGAVAYFALVPNNSALQESRDSSVSPAPAVDSGQPSAAKNLSERSTRKSRAPRFSGFVNGGPGNRQPVPKPEHTRVNLISPFGDEGGKFASIAVDPAALSSRQVNFVDEEQQDLVPQSEKNIVDFQESETEEYLDFGNRRHATPRPEPVLSTQSDLEWLRSLKSQSNNTQQPAVVERSSPVPSEPQSIQQSAVAQAKPIEQSVEPVLSDNRILPSEQTQVLLETALVEERNQKVTTVAKRIEEPPMAPKRQDVEIVGWPLPESLLVELEHLGQYEMTQEWAISTREALHTLNQLEIADPASRPWIDQCNSLANQLRSASNDLVQTSPGHADSCYYMLQVAQKLKRRAEIWGQIHDIAIQNLARFPDANGSIVATHIANRSREMNFDAIDAGWKEYLMLDKAQEIFSDPDSKQSRYQAIAQRIMARVTSSGLSQEQSSYAQHLIGNELGEVLRTVAVGPFDPGQFLIDIERYESRPSVGSRERLSRHYQSLYWNRNTESRELAGLLDDHYRNANVRFEISQTLLDMIASTTTTYREPVTDRILGASVLGQSQITNQVRFQMVPDAERLSFQLQSTGRVLSNTRAHARGFTFSNLANGEVVAFKTISVGNQGYGLEPTHVTANNQTRLTDIQGQMDGVPVFGSIARRIAHQQQESQGFQAKQIVEKKLRNEFRSRIDSEVNTKLAQYREMFVTKVLQPLRKLQLEPKAVQLQTTDQSAIVRYRLAALDQTAADTPRPLALPSSLANFQLHHSAINNMINRIEINGKEFSPQQFMDHLNLLLGRDDLKIPAGQHKDVLFQFDTRDPIKLAFQDNQVQIELRIRKLQIGKRTRWTNLLVTAQYSPVAQGQKIRLTFDEDFGLRVKNNRLKLADQLAVRTIFSTLFQPEFEFNLLPKEIAQHPTASQLRISHLTLTEGWLGVSLSRIQPQPMQPDSNAVTIQIGDQPWSPRAPLSQPNVNARNQSPRQSSRFNRASSQGIIGDWR